MAGTYSAIEIWAVFVEWPATALVVEAKLPVGTEFGAADAFPTAADLSIGAGVTTRFAVLLVVLKVGALAVAAIGCRYFAAVGKFGRVVRIAFKDAELEHGISGAPAAG